MVFLQIPVLNASPLIPNYLVDCYPNQKITGFPFSPNLARILHPHMRLIFAIITIRIKIFHTTEVNHVKLPQEANAETAR